MINSTSSIEDISESALLNEAVPVAAFNKVSTIMQRYLKRVTNGRIFQSSGADMVKDTVANIQVYGIRFFVPSSTPKSIRFNWKASVTRPESADLVSLDYWNPQGVRFHIRFDKPVSLAKVLPLAANIITKGLTSTVIYTAQDIVTKIEPHSDDAESPYSPLGDELPESTNLMEDAITTNLVADVVKILSQAEFTQNDIWTKLKAPGFAVYKEILVRYPSAIQKSGRKLKFSGGTTLLNQIASQANDILAATGAVRGMVTRGAPEKYKSDPEVTKLENEMGRLSYEKQLEDLENLLKLVVVSESSNALFVAGRGGIGKTHTVEQVLADLGFKDGEGYFKNTGSISAAGLYLTLYKHREGIVFFDDTDDVFKDQTSRNIIKAATDTKKRRKLVWNKAGSNVVDPGEFGDDDLEDGKIPRYFDFTGKIIFISNLNPDQLDPDGAIRTRSFMIDISPTDEEVYDFMEKIVDKVPVAGGVALSAEQRKHVVKLLRDGKSKQSANLRKLSRGLNMFAGTLKAGVKVSDSELSRMIAMYA